MVRSGGFASTNCWHRFGLTRKDRCGSLWSAFPGSAVGQAQQVSGNGQDRVGHAPIDRKAVPDSGCHIRGPVCLRGQGRRLVIH